MDEKILKDVIRTATLFFLSETNVKQFRKGSLEVANMLNIKDVELLQAGAIILAILLIYEEYSKSKIMFQ